MIHYKMDLYNIDSAVSQGNQISSETRGVSDNVRRDRASNVAQASKVLTNDKGGENLDIAKFSGTDTLGGVEAPSAIKTLVDTSREAGGYASLAKGDLSRVASAGAKVAQGASDLAGVAGRGLGITSSFTPSKVPFVRQPIVGNAERGASGGIGDATLIEDHVAPPSAVTSVSGAVKNGVEVGSEGVAKYDSLADAGSLTKYALRNVVGVADKASLELGSKVVGGLGGALAGEEDVKNLITTGSVFQKGESGFSEAGNIGQMGGAVLDVASVALPFLAPFALAANLLSAGASTYGNIKDDQTAKAGAQAQIQSQAKSGSQAVTPAWSQLGMVASSHQTANPVQ